MIRSELIDDCALASIIKKDGSIWLGLTQGISSLRNYKRLMPIWDMVARTAYVQLRFSPVYLLRTVIGMLFLYMVPPLSAIGGLVLVTVRGGTADLWLGALGVGAWGLMSTSYAPMLRWHGVSGLMGPVLHLAALLYTAMTVDSAIRWTRGTGGGWKGRTYPGKR